MSGHSKGHNMKPPKHRATKVLRKYKITLAQFGSNQINKNQQSR